MMKNVLLLAGILLFLVLGNSCDEKKVALSKEQFTELLIDIHRVDGTLAVERGRNGSNELRNYAYYNDLFKKYGITRAEFDSCMYYYSAKNALFSKMYDVVIDSLNKQQTIVDKVLNELKSRDSVNYFPIADTLNLDTVYTVYIDSIVPGLYKFNTTIKFDSVDNNRNRRIASFFVSANDQDTLFVRNVIVSLDTMKRNYNWSQYTDSLYSRLVIRYMDIIPEKDRPKKYDKKGKVIKTSKKEKEVDLKDFGGEAWDNQLFRPYISRDTERRLKQGLRRK